MAMLPIHFLINIFLLFFFYLQVNFKKQTNKTWFQIDHPVWDCLQSNDINLKWLKNLKKKTSAIVWLNTVNKSKRADRALIDENLQRMVIKTQILFNCHPCKHLTSKRQATN